MRCSLRTNNITTTYYIGAGQEVQNGVPVRYYSLGGNTLGVRQGASVSWLYGDHLGSTSASSGAASISELYAGNTGWYDILRDAQDGDSITAFLPDGNGTSIQGAFGRTDQRRITVDMGHNQIVDESVFATFGGRRSGMSAQYGWASDYGNTKSIPIRRIRFRWCSNTL